MKKILIITLLLLFFQQFLFSQEITLQGKIQDESGEPLAYVNIGVLGTSTGTVSDSTGNYKLFLKDVKVIEGNTLRFSSIGYEAKSFAIQELLNQSKLDVRLQKSDIELEEIVVTVNDRKSSTTGKDKIKTSRYVNFSISSVENQNLGSQVGRKFKLSSKTSNHLKSFRFYINNNDFEQVKFRINVYAIEDGLPDKILNKENIFVEVKGKQTGWVSVDLSPYNLVVKDDVIVSAEWIEHSEKGRKLSLPIIIPSVGSTHYYKFGSQSNWKKFPMLSSAMVLEYEK